MHSGARMNQSVSLLMAADFVTMRRVQTGTRHRLVSGVRVAHTADTVRIAHFAKSSQLAAAPPGLDLVL